MIFMVLMKCNWSNQLKACHVEVLKMWKQNWKVGSFCFRFESKIKGKDLITLDRNECAIEFVRKDLKKTFQENWNICANLDETRRFLKSSEVFAFLIGIFQFLVYWIQSSDSKFDSFIDHQFPMKFQIISNFSAS